MTISDSDEVFQKESFFPPQQSVWGDLYRYWKILWVLRYFIGWCGPVEFERWLTRGWKQRQSDELAGSKNESRISVKCQQPTWQTVVLHYTTGSACPTTTAHKHHCHKQFLNQKCEVALDNISWSTCIPTLRQFYDFLNSVYQFAAVENQEERGTIREFLELNRYRINQMRNRDQLQLRSLKNQTIPVPQCPMKNH